MYRSATYQFLSAFILIFTSLIFSSQIFAADLTWSETRPLGNVNHAWNKSALSTNGQVILVVGASGQVVLSKDRGSTWTVQDPLGDFLNYGEIFDNTWQCAAVSGDGQKLLTVAYGLRVVLSTNGGTTWTDAQPTGNVDANWNGCAMSKDGQTMIAGQHTGRLYLSTNGGISWSEVRPSGNINLQWRSFAISSDGQIIIAATYGQRIYRSTNQGSSWTEIQPAGNTDGGWNVLSMSDNGQTIIAGLDGGRVYLSTDGSASWHELQLLGDIDNDWRTSAVSGDGQKILLGTSVSTSVYGRLFYSTNRGTSFDELQLAGNTDNNWYAAGISGDGYTLISGINSGRLYLGLYPLPVTSPVSSGNTSSIVMPLASTCGDEKPSQSPQLFQINTTEDRATLYFSPIGNTNEYVVSFSTQPYAEDYGASMMLSPEGVQNYTIFMLKPNTKYYFKVRGQHGCMPGDWSNILAAKTSSSSLQKKFFLFN